jgi:probable DNA repair protein
MVDGLTEEIAAALERGATVLTGNQRAARELRRAWDTRNRDAGRERWSPPRILAWSTWTAGLWHGMLLAGTADAMLLNRAQEAALWRGVIAQDESISTLRPPGTLAAMAAQAWAALAKYRGLGRLKHAATNADTEAFVAWASSFEERCRASLFLPEARLEGVLRKALQKNNLNIDGEILLVGFDRLLPAQIALLDAIADAGAGIETTQAPPLPEQRLLVAVDDEPEELRLAAGWIRDRLRESPEARIAVVVPGLADRRSRIERVFRETLAPETHAIGQQDTGPFEFSAGEALAERPMVSVALDLLHWAVAPMELERLSDLLLSPYFAWGAESSARAEFDAFELRDARLLRPVAAVDWLARSVAGSKRAPRLSRTLAALRALDNAAKRRLATGERRPHGDWAEAIREILAAAGWASRGGTDSIEFQTRERWEGVLDELATLDFEGGRVSFESALEALREIVAVTVFAPESRDAPVQILGPEESAGQRFDALWFLGAGDLTWPPGASGSALLSWPLRRELGMPGSDAEKDADDARWVTERVARCAARTVVFSYARETPEGRQRPSASLASLDLQPLEGLPEALPEPLVELETVEDHTPIAPLPDRPIAGGARVLQSQAACGFRAFAEHRLFASDVQTRALGMDPRERGIAVHLVLERFWEVVRTQSTLRAMTSEARHETLARVIDRALDEAAAAAETDWDEAYLETQRRRLMTLGMDWLAMEADRAVPFTVAEREVDAQDVAIGPLRLSLRIDRIDVVPGGAVLIDYKTGDAKPAAWLTDRPDEPQLPLYAILAVAADLQAVAFGRIRPGKEMGLTGFQSEPGILTHPARDFVGMEAQLDQWRGTLTVLAEDFASGHAHVSPKQYPVTCTRCGQRLLCRVDAAALMAANDEEDGLA